MISKKEFRLIMLKQDSKFGKFRIWRVMRGGLWLKFTNNEWSRCKWIERLIPGYIANPYGGEFHRSFKEIVKVEEYWHGHKHSIESN